MDPIRNPFTPGAGTPPPELAGRDGLREDMRVAVARIRAGRPAKSMILIGLRGVGKTVLLDRLRDDAIETGVHTLRIEAPESRSLPAMLAPELRSVLLRLSRSEQVRDLAERSLRGLAGFVKAMRVQFQDIEVGLDFEPEPGLADNGDLEHDLQTVFELTGRAAQAAKSAVVIFIDELQYVARDQLAPLITSLHRTAQLSLPVTLVGAGLPQLPGQMGHAKSYAERLFEFRQIGPLETHDARIALAKPVRAEGADIEDDALDRIIEVTGGYPYFIQEWGKHAWEVADASPITRDDVAMASRTALADLDESFFRVRFDRLTPAERRYLRGMSDLGPGPHRSGDIAEALGRSVQSLAPTRSQLIAKGMIWSPNHGETAFTVPMFDDFMRRTMPGDDWQT